MAEQRFVARQTQLHQLRAFLDQALAGRGQVTFVVGEAGSGKTALIAEFARRAQEAHKDLVFAIGNCNAQTGIGDPYLPFREILAQLTGDVEGKLAKGAFTSQNGRRLSGMVRLSCETLIEFGPDLINILVPGSQLLAKAGKFVAKEAGWLDRLRKLVGSKAGLPANAALEQSRIFEQFTNVLKALAAKKPLVLVLDDLQWTDAASASLLFHLGRRIESSRILVLGAYRPEEVQLGRGGDRHPLEKVLTEFKRYFGDVWVDLDQAEKDQAPQFVDALLDLEPNCLGAVFRQALLQHTGGHPLFAVELLRDMQEQGHLRKDAKGRWTEGARLDWEALPSRVEGVIEERIGRLEEQLAETLKVGSVEGVRFTAEVIARVQGAEVRSLLRRLSNELDKRHRLVAAQGVRMLGPQALSFYRFRHSLFQAYLYNSLDAAERTYLHADVGNALEALYGEEAAEGNAVQLAYHWEQAGRGDRAIPYLLRAGDAARLAYAHQEAIGFYQRALRFLEQQADPEPAARTWMKLGLTYHTAFDFPRSREAYERGFLLWQRAGQTPSAANAAPQTLRVQLPEPTLLDPSQSVDMFSNAIIGQLFRALVQFTPELDVVPDAAHSWEIEEGGRTYVFHLRQDMQWSDGRPVTADDFLFGLQRAVDGARQAGTNVLLWSDIKGVRAYLQGELSDVAQVGVRARDGATLVIELEEPTGYILQLLTRAYALPRHAVEKYGESWSEPAHIVTNGPFRLLDRQPGTLWILERNPGYQGRFSGNVQRVEVHILAGGALGHLEAYERGEIDIADFLFLEPTEFERVRQQYAGEHVSAPELTVWFMGFDMTRPPFSDARVRRALVLSADREPLARLTGTHAIAATGGVVPPGVPGHSPGIALPYDPDRARNLLAQAGYGAGGHLRFPRVELWHFGGPGTEAAAHLISQWQQNLGVEVYAQSLDWATYLDRMGKGLPHLWVMAWIADYPDPDDFLRVGVSHFRRDWPRQPYEELLETARRITDQSQRMQLYQQADRMVIEEALVLPWMYSHANYLVKPWVRSYPLPRIGPPFWKDVVIEAH